MVIYTIFILKKHIITIIIMFIFIIIFLFFQKNQRYLFRFLYFYIFESIIFFVYCFTQIFDLLFKIENLLTFY